jgi:hypothetical protein
VVEDVPWFDLPAGAASSALGKSEVRSYQILFRGVCARCRALPARRGVRE